MNENCLETILSLKDVNNIPGVRVTMDTSIEKATNVILRDGTVFRFNSFGWGLYYYDISSTNVEDSAKTNSTITPY